MEMNRPPAYKWTWVEDGKQEIYLEWPYQDHKNNIYLGRDIVTPPPLNYAYHVANLPTVRLSISFSGFVDIFLSSTMLRIGLCSFFASSDAAITKSSISDLTFHKIWLRN